MIRRRIWYSGRVQGVGFRYTACGVARKFNVAGYVRNLPDGRVEAVAEGDIAEVERFIAAVASEMSGQIRSADHQDSPATGEFTGFEVRF